MTNESLLRKQGEDYSKDLYKVKLLSHWSEIVNINDPEDTHHVKWYGGGDNEDIGALYVSSPGGIGFITVKE